MDVAIASCLTLPEPDPDEAPLLAALAAAGLSTAVMAWDDPGADFAAARVTVIRSTWNYIHQLDEYRAWAERTASVSRLWNPPAIVRANSHKQYLLELREDGVPVVPTRLLRRGEALALAEVLGEWPEVVIKPAVSAGSFGTRRANAANLAAGQAHLDALLATRDVLVQPYLASVTGHGERALVWIDGALTHAVQKTPRFHGEHESVSEAVAISPAEAALAEQALAATRERHRAALLYARIDVAPGDDGRPLVMELELTEPSLFLVQAPAAMARLVAAIAARVREVD